MTSPYKGRRRASYIIELIGQNNDALEERNVILMKEVLDLKKRKARLKTIFESISHRDVCKLNKPKCRPLSPLLAPECPDQLEDRTKNASIDTEQRQVFFGDLTNESTPRGSARVQPWAGSKAKNKVYKWPTTNYVHWHDTYVQKSAPVETIVDKSTERTFTSLSPSQGRRNKRVEKGCAFKNERKMSIVEEISMFSGSDCDSMTEYLLQNRGSCYPEKIKLRSEDLKVSEAPKDTETFSHPIAAFPDVTPLHYDSIINLEDPFLLKEYGTDTSYVSRGDLLDRSHGGKMRTLSMSGQVGQANLLIKSAKRRQAQPYGSQDLISEFNPSSLSSSKLEGFRHRSLDQNDSKEDKELSQANKDLDASLHFREISPKEPINTDNALKAKKVAKFSIEQEACLEDVIQVIKMEESTSKHVGDRREAGKNFKVEPRRLVTNLSPSGLSSGYFVDVRIPHGQDGRSKVTVIDQIKAELMETYPVFSKNRKVKMIDPSFGEEIDCCISDSCTDGVINSSANRAVAHIERFNNKKAKLVDPYFEEIDKIKTKLLESFGKFETTDISLTRDILEPVVKLRTPPTKSGVNIQTTPHTFIPSTDDYKVKHETTDHFNLNVIEDTRPEFHVISDPHSVELRSLQDDVILNNLPTSKTKSLHHKTHSDTAMKSVCGTYQSGNNVSQTRRPTPKLMTHADDFSCESFLGHHKVEEHGQLLVRYENLTLLDRGTVDCVKPE